MLIFNESDTVGQMIVEAAQTGGELAGGAWDYVPSPDLPRLRSEVIVEPWVREAFIRLNPEIAAQPGRAVTISTDAHSTREFGAVRYGIDQVRRSGLEPASVLNCLPWSSLEPLFRR